MDHLIYTAMSAATTLLDRQAVVSNNLANADTSGFRADISVFQQAPIAGKGLQTRTQVAHGTSGVDFTPGAVQTTGRPLDVALPGPGFLAVQAADGNEAYTRSGSLQVAADGTLVTSTGLPVLGDGGPISIPPDTTVSIAADGTVSGITTARPDQAGQSCDHQPGQGRRWLVSHQGRLGCIGRSDRIDHFRGT
jgi:flagellar basal-body rod protein FlgF